MLVHGGIRHLEKWVIAKFRAIHVHGGIRHLENELLANTAL